MSQVHNALKRLEQSAPMPLSTAGLDAEHWLFGFLDELLKHFRTSNGASFEAVHALLEHHEEVFLRDLEIARRMYRTYPHLLQAQPIENQRSQGA